MSAIIKPTIGRVVLYSPSDNDPGGKSSQPHAATVAYVWNDGMVNLSVVDSNGTPYSRTSVPLIQPEFYIDGEDISGCARWMDYQIGQAAKEKALESSN